MEVAGQYITKPDLAVVGLLALYLLLGLSAGAIKAGLGLTRALILAATLAVLADRVTPEVARVAGLSSVGAYQLSVIVITIGVWLASRILVGILRPVIFAMSSTGFDYLAGAALGLAHGAVLLLIAVGLTGFVPRHMIDELWDESVLLPRAGKASKSFWQHYPAEKDSFGELLVTQKYDHKDYQPRLREGGLLGPNMLEQLTQARGVFERNSEAFDRLLEQTRGNR